MTSPIKAQPSNGGDDTVDQELLQVAAQADGQNDPVLTKRNHRGRPKQPEPEMDPAVHEQRLNKLKFLLQRSGVYSRIMGEKMERERRARAEAAAKQSLKQQDVKDPQADENRPALQPRKTRSNATTQDDPSSAASSSKVKKDAPQDHGRKRKAAQDYQVSNYIDENDLEEAKAAAAAAAAATATQNKRQKTTDQDDQKPDKAAQGRRQQPKLVTGAVMREYQLDGLEWLVSLYENGLNGILADEMGLGKTLQTISFLAHLREKGVWGPFLIVSPLSTINNWVLEFNRFTPDLPVIMYHGSAEERKQMRDLHLQTPTIRSEQLLFPIVVTSYEIVIRDRSHLAHHPWKFIVVDEGHRLKNLNCRLVRELKTYKSANRLIITGTPLHNNLSELWSLLNFILPDIFDDLATFEAWFDFSDIHQEHGSSHILSKENTTSVITQLHEILKPFLLRRLKADVETNLPPKKEYLLYAPLTALQKELYNAVAHGEIRQWLLQRKASLTCDEIESILQDPEGVMLQSETPDTNQTSVCASANTSRGNSPKPSNQLRTMDDDDGDDKDDETSKNETPRRQSKTPKESEAATDSSYTQQTEKQNSSRSRKKEDDDDSDQGYQSDGTGSSGGGGGTGGSSTPLRRSSRRTAAKGTRYRNDDGLDDDIYFDNLAHERNGNPVPLTVAQAERQGKLYSIRQAQKQINNMHLENVVMQARKICNHPFLFDWPIDNETGMQVVNKDLINASGKMLMLNRLLDELFQRGHKVLIFSQFTTMLDIIEEWAHEYKNLKTCRIDGSTSQVDRREQMRSFNEDKGPDACNLFLLSTRAGGLGINLVAADTVIFYDSDWNPQMDLQAQDRVHRIGQTKPCLIFRLVAANTVEQRILKRAGNKRKLEALVIQQGKFKLPAGYHPTSIKKKREDELKEMALQLLKLEGEEVQLVVGEKDEIISDENLEKLLDRSEAAYQRRTGWVTSKETDYHHHRLDGGAIGGGGKDDRTVFEVTETVVDEANEEIAKLLAQ